ncbi:bifunctional 4-hydroxy-2-oxoglutarate aldolase/2-dehydro-3-deoxy-phosphogluconate aldolase [Homoserinibacter sp. YIM 151385]|uniref:bifunctional 4-hydroxy-2-oxoglutarate aldolase/2-dehydro-3-deoxy-phosphogluconate aldolase n=1 Tax=Homoserinibacter sp. YIM 151385 TaxID=2985506 RepID=UPI0022F06AFC|nr:bifunctional 4-hydroxy-2-oxoglutarate aldolase/2-dehydro-3-deoxy-phosphogluconate aldolase [Homoserinibacter sp. YIM 151385]WBU37512.1 bifunctional 4-hydroxy-2-oxoglutarate aldolase/2-dehydro-3-deoxy-phosphogluconate aldolase [Homoserinibacter sp. YIM 151385]
MSDSTADRLTRSRIVPVVTVRDPAHVDAISAGLAEGGIRAIEVTLRTPHGLPAIRRLAARGELEVGAGTVLDAHEAREVADAGASFAVSPGLDEAVVEASLERGLLSLPGIATASELQRARSLGVRQVKVFPVEVLGGLRLLEALHGPFPDMALMPSGGVTPASAPGYLAHPAVFAVGGSWLVPGGEVGDLARVVRERAAATVAALDHAAGRG